MRSRIYLYFPAMMAGLTSQPKPLTTHKRKNTSSFKYLLHVESMLKVLFQALGAFERQEDEKTVLWELAVNGEGNLPHQVSQKERIQRSREQPLIGSAQAVFPCCSREISLRTKFFRIVPNCWFCLFLSKKFKTFVIMRDGTAIFLGHPSHVKV